MNPYDGHTHFIQVVDILVKWRTRMLCKLAIYYGCKQFIAAVCCFMSPREASLRSPLESNHVKGEAVTGCLIPLLDMLNHRRMKRFNYVITLVHSALRYAESSTNEKVLLCDNFSACIIFLEGVVNIRQNSMQR